MSATLGSVSGLNAYRLTKSTIIKGIESAVFEIDFDIIRFSHNSINLVRIDKPFGGRIVARNIQWTWFILIKLKTVTKFNSIFCCGYFEDIRRMIIHVLYNFRRKL